MTKKYSKKERDKHFSNKTSTKKREKKKRLVPDYQSLDLVIQKASPVTIEEKNIYIEHGITHRHLSTKDLILNNTTKGVILKLNEKSIKIQSNCIKELGLSLNRLHFPTDLSKIIISKALNGIYIEKDIFKVLTPQMINIFYKKGEDDEIIEENELYFLMKEYMKNDHIYGFLKAVMINELRPLGWQKVLPAELPRKTLITISTRRRLTYNHHYYTNYDGYIIDQFN